MSQQITYLYLDACGQSIDQRLWGGVAALGEKANQLLYDKMDSLEKNYEKYSDAAGEIKGKYLPNEELRKIINEVNKISQIFVFCCSKEKYTLQNMKQERENFLHHLKALSKKFGELEQLIAFYSDLKKVNKHKFLSICYHIMRTLKHLPNVDQFINSICIYIDEENFPQARVFVNALREYLCARIGEIGVSKSIARKAYKDPDHKLIRVYGDCDSTEISGIRYIDMVLSYVWRTFGDTQGITIEI